MLSSTMFGSFLLLLQLNHNALTMTSKQSDGPFISFVIPCFNLSRELLVPCIESILALPLEPSEREVIVVDDGSEVCLLDHLDGYQDKVLYIRQANQGLSGARNTGLNMSRGQYVQFVDGDDMLKADAYTHCLSLLRADSELDMVMFETASEESEVTGFIDDAPESGADYMRHNNLHGSACSYVFRRVMAGQLRFTPGILHEDEEFTPQLVLRAEKVVHTNAAAYFYRTRENSIMRNTNRQHLQKRLDDQEAVIGRLNTMADRMPAADRAAMQRRVHQLTMDYLYNIIVLDGSAQELETRIERLKVAGLFPLPDKNYTRKYTWFRRMTMNKLTRRMLIAALCKKKGT